MKFLSPIQIRHVFNVSYYRMFIVREVWKLFAEMSKRYQPNHKVMYGVTHFDRRGEIEIKLK